jgi:hypothetical protein
MITILCWVSLIVWFIFAMGINTPVYSFLFYYVPGLSDFRRPADGAYFVNLFLALLIGSSRMPARSRLAPWPIPPIVGTVLLVVFGSLLTRLALYAQDLGHGLDLLIVLRAFAWRLIIVVAIGLILESINRRTARYLVARIANSRSILCRPHRRSLRFRSARLSTGPGLFRNLVLEHPTHSVGAVDLVLESE